MDDIFLGEVEVPLDHLAHIRTGLVLGKPLLDHFAEIRVAELGDDVGIILGGEDIMEHEYVRE